MISLYSKPGCVYCDMAKSWLTEYAFEFEAIDVMADPQALAFVKNAGHRTVPQIYHNGQILVDGGYSGLNKLSPDDLRTRLA